MKEQQTQSDHEQEQMALDRKNILQEQEKFRLLNQQRLAQVAALQSNSMQAEGDPGNDRYPDLLTLDEQIQKRIGEDRLLDHLTPSTKIHESRLFKDIQSMSF